MVQLLVGFGGHGTKAPLRGLGVAQALQKPAPVRVQLSRPAAVAVHHLQTNQPQLRTDPKPLNVEHPKKTPLGRQLDPRNSDLHGWPRPSLRQARHLRPQPCHLGRVLPATLVQGPALRRQRRQLRRAEGAASTKKHATGCSSFPFLPLPSLFRLPQLPSRLHSLFPSPPVSSWSSTRCRSTASPSSQTRGSSWEALQLHLPGGHRAMPSHGAHSAWNCWQFPRALRPQSPRFLSLVISSRWLLVSGHFCPPRHLPGRNWMACSRPGGILFGKCCASGTKPTVLSSVQAGKYAYE